MGAIEGLLFTQGRRFIKLLFVKYCVMRLLFEQLLITEKQEFLIKM